MWQQSLQSSEDPSSIKSCLSILCWQRAARLTTQHGTIFWHESSNCLSERMHSHIGCMCLKLFSTVFSRVGSRSADDDTAWNSLLPRCSDAISIRPLTPASQSFKRPIFWPENFKYMKSPKAHCQTNTSMKLEIISWTNNRLLNLWFIHLSHFHIRGCSSQMFKKPIYIRFWQWSTQHCRSTPAIFILVTFIYHFIRKKLK